MPRAVSRMSPGRPSTPWARAPCAPQVSVLALSSGCGSRSFGRDHADVLILARCWGLRRARPVAVGDLIARAVPVLALGAALEPRQLSRLGPLAMRPTR